VEGQGKLFLKAMVDGIFLTTSVEFLFSNNRY
jgi:hypothetical protein